MSGQENPEKKLRVLTLMNQFYAAGGLENASTTPPNAFKDCADCDALVWQNNRQNQIKLRDFENRTRVPIAESLRAAIASCAFFSVEFWFSASLFFSGAASISAKVGFDFI